MRQRCRPQPPAIARRTRSGGTVTPHPQSSRVGAPRLGLQIGARKPVPAPLLLSHSRFPLPSTQNHITETQCSDSPGSAELEKRRSLLRCSISISDRPLRAVRELARQFYCPFSFSFAHNPLSDRVEPAVRPSPEFAVPSSPPTSSSALVSSPLPTRSPCAFVLEFSGR
jgi:hypothetical protein